MIDDAILANENTLSFYRVLIGERPSEGCVVGIDVAMVDENHEASLEVFDPKQFLTALAMKEWPDRSASVCLRFIDPWGDTVFNQTQIPILLDELRQCEREQTDREVKAHLRKVIRLVEQAEGRAHIYIKFIGD